MDWIKVTQAMPPSTEPVIVTVRSKKDHGFKEVLLGVIWNEVESDWCWTERDCYIFLEENMEVTHWMPYPQPAED